MKFFLIFFILTLFGNNLILTSQETDKMKVKSKIKATIQTNNQTYLQNHSVSYFFQKYFRKILSIDDSIKKCSEDNCQHCCLTPEMCGTKEQCELTSSIRKIFLLMFLTVVLILTAFFIYKLYLTDSEPEHSEKDKIDESTLNYLIKLYMQNKENQKKFKN